MSNEQIPQTKRDIGTPKTLDEAINNAAEELSFLIMYKDDVPVMKKHIKDFLAQKFSVYMMSEIPDVSNSMQALWYDLFGEVK